MGKQALLFSVPVTGKKTSKRKAPDVERIKVDHKLAKRRYYLHKQLDPAVYLIDGTLRHIATPYSCFMDIPKGERYYIGQLIQLGYNVQYKLI